MFAREATVTGERIFENVNSSPEIPEKVPAVSDSWNLEQSEQFCLTLSKGHTREEVLEIYGARRGVGGMLTSFEAENIVEPSPADSMTRPALVRAGRVGDWSFGIEFQNPIGFLDGILRPLSQGTETILLFRNVRALSSFRYMVDGRDVEVFEPCTRSGNSGRSEHDFFRRFMQSTATAANDIAAALTVITKHIGHHLTGEMLTGPLLTAVIPIPDRRALEGSDLQLQRTPLVDNPQPRPLGRYLGSLRPGEEPPRP